jgi:predicted PurR-regulated permease PerM
MDPNPGPVQNFQHPKMANWFFACLFMSFLVFLWFMFRDFLHAIVLGLIFCGVLNPLFDKLLEKTTIGRSLGSIIFTLALVLVLFLPLAFLCFQLVKEALHLYQILSASLASGEFHGLFDLIKKIETYLHIDLGVDALKGTVVKHINDIFTIFISSLNHYLSNVAQFFYQFIVMIFVIFTFFKEGPALKKFLRELSPLTFQEENLLMQQFNQMNYVTLMSNGMGGVIQGLLAGIGLAIVGIGSLMFWTSLMIFLAFIPFVGIAFVMYPIAIYLYLKGESGHALFLAIYALVIAQIIENIFKPLFVGKRVQMNPLFVFFCILGGLNLFGLLGIFYGPLIGIIFLTLAELYQQKYLSNTVGGQRAGGQ